MQRAAGYRTQDRAAAGLLLLKRPSDEVATLAESITQLKARIVNCRVCFNVTEGDPCRICSDPARNTRALCVVEEPNDLLAIERTGEFRGRYHVLLGALSPLDGIGPEDLKVRELLSRLEQEPVDEIILATNPSVEGEATAIFLGKLLKPFRRASRESRVGCRSGVTSSTPTRSRSRRRSRAGERWARIALPPEGRPARRSDGQSPVGRCRVDVR